jgi:hypothetical protein
MCRCYLTGRIGSELAFGAYNGAVMRNITLSYPISGGVVRVGRNGRTFALAQKSWWLATPACGLQIAFYNTVHTYTLMETQRPFSS